MSEKKSTGFWALLGKGLATVFKGAKLLKVIFAAATFASYAYMFTWKFALMVLIAIGFHESGHVWAMKKTGMKTKGFYFLPFLGGVAVGTERETTSTSYVTYSENISGWSAGDTVELWYKAIGSGAIVSVRNFSVMADKSFSNLVVAD